MILTLTILIMNNIASHISMYSGPVVAGIKEIETTSSDEIMQLLHRLLVIALLFYSFLFPYNSLLFNNLQLIAWLFICLFIYLFTYHLFTSYLFAEVMRKGLRLQQLLMKCHPDHMLCCRSVQCSRVEWSGV